MCVLRYSKTVNVKLMCDANVNKFNKYFIHITVYIQLFLICTTSLLTWNSLHILLYANCTTTQWSGSHGFLSTEVSISQILPCKLDLRHWLCTLLPLSWCFSLQKKFSVKIVGQKRVGREWVQKIGALVRWDRRMYVALTQADSSWWTHEWL